MAAVAAGKKKKLGASSHKDCAHCGEPEKPGATNKSCSRCKLSYYCGLPCQKAHWKEHKLLCIPVEERRIGQGVSSESEQPEHVCPICMVNPDDMGEGAMCVACGQFVCCECRPKYEETAQDCPMCRAPFAKSRENKSAMLKKLIYDRTFGRYTRVAEYMLGQIYFEKGGAEFNPSDALKLWEASAEKGYIYAAHNTYLMHLGEDELGNSTGLPRNLSQAVIFCKRAADLGYAPDMNKMGYYHETGQGFNSKKNLSEACQWYKKAAEANDVDGYHNYALCLYHGKGLPTRDFTEARVFFRKAASNGHGNAQLMLSRMLLEGKGGCKDAAAAHKWMVRAAAQNVDNAIFSVGNNFRLGQGVDQDYEQALVWFRKGVSKCCADCQLIMGEMHLGLNGGKEANVKYDKAEAKRLLQLSANQQNKIALQRLKVIDKTMPPNQQRREELDVSDAARRSGYSMTNSETGVSVPVLAPHDPRWANPTKDDLALARKMISQGKTSFDMQSVNPMLGGWMLGLEMKAILGEDIEENADYPKHDAEAPTSGKNKHMADDPDKSIIVHEQTCQAVQLAINKAPPGSVIQLKPGAYAAALNFPEIVVSKGVTLLGGYSEKFASTGKCSPCSILTCTLRIKENGTSKGENVKISNLQILNGIVIEDNSYNTIHLNALFMQCFQREDNISIANCKGKHVLVDECVVNNGGECISSLGMNTALHIKNCEILGATYRGVFANSTFLIEDSIIRGCGSYGMKCRAGAVLKGNKNQLQEGPWDHLLVNVKPSQSQGTVRDMLGSSGVPESPQSIFQQMLGGGGGGVSGGVMDFQKSPLFQELMGGSVAARGGASSVGGGSRFTTMPGGPSSARNSTGAAAQEDDWGLDISNGGSLKPTPSVNKKKNKKKGGKKK